MASVIHGTSCCRSRSLGTLSPMATRWVRTSPLLSSPLSHSSSTLLSSLPPSPLPARAPNSTPLHLSPLSGTDPLLVLLPLSVAPPHLPSPLLPSPQSLHLYSPLLSHSPSLGSL